MRLTWVVAVVEMTTELIVSVYVPVAPAKGPVPPVIVSVSVLTRYQFADRPFFRPSICRVGADRASVVRSRRSPRHGTFAPGIGTSAAGTQARLMDISRKWAQAARGCERG